MRKCGLTLLAVAAIGLAGSQVASAADMPVKAAPRYVTPPPPVYTWTGFYIGLQGGYGWSNDDWHLQQNAVDFSFDGTGGFVGGYAGYNWQINNFVIGAEVEGSWADISKDGQDCTIFQTALCSTKVEGLGSVRGRLGFVFGPQNQLLAYAAGGWALASAKYNRVFQPNGVPFTSGVSDTINGWVVGGGLEWMFMGYPNWIARIQYDHYDFSDNTYNVPALSNVSDTTVSTRVDTIRAGVAYKF